GCTRPSRSTGNLPNSVIWNADFSRGGIRLPIAQAAKKIVTAQGSQRCQPFTGAPAGAFLRAALAVLSDGNSFTFFMRSFFSQTRSNGSKTGLPILLQP